MFKNKALVYLLSALCLVWQLTPAVSAALFLVSGGYSGISDPRYTCVNTLYISTTGNDANNGLTPGTAIATLTQAQALAVTAQGNGAGYCVRYLPGTYSTTQFLTIGGTTDSLTGYMALVSDTRGAAKIRGNSFDGFDATHTGGTGPCGGTSNYVIVDGFDVSGTTGFGGGSGINVSFSHHDKVINNTIHDSSGAGLQTNCEDYFLANNNIIYNNAGRNSSNYSGISDLQPGTFDTAPGFHHFLTNNTVFKNGIGYSVTATHTDGNGIILDGWGVRSYKQLVLVEDNVIYNNGGRCIEALQALTAPAGTIRNNTCFHNVQDSLLDPFSPCELLFAASTGFTVVNNVFAADLTFRTGTDAICDNGTDGGSIVSQNFYYNNLTFNGTPGAASVGLVSTISVVTSGNGNLLGVNPLLTAPSTNLAMAKFNLQPASSAVAVGTLAYGYAAQDRAGNPRVLNGQIDIGAYEGAITPTWMQPGATDDLNFANQLYTGTGLVATYISSSGASNVGSDLLWTSPAGFVPTLYPAGSPRVAFAAPGPGPGLLVEPTTTNYLINSRTPGTQTTGTLAAATYTLWVNAAPTGTATLSGCATGVATQGNYFTFTLGAPAACTVTLSGARTWAFQLENNAYPTSWILSGGSPTTRGTDKPLLAGNALTTAIGTAATVLVNVPGTLSPFVSGVNNIDFVRGNSAFFLVANTSNTIASFPGPLTSAIGGTTWTNPLIAAIGWDGTGRSVGATGQSSLVPGVVASDATSITGNTSVALGAVVGGGGEYGAPINEYADWNSRLSNSVLQQLTQLTYP